jgi:hypothetical protein
VEDALITCPLCKKDTLYRRIFVPHVHVVGDCLGILAEKNAKGMSNDLINKTTEEQKTQREQVLHPDCGVVNNTPKQKIANNKYCTLSDKEVQKLTPQQQQKYIMTGEK